MSAECVGWVYKHSPARGAAFAVHLASADSANDQNQYELWMRQGKLAAKARVSRKAAGEALAWLVAEGLLVLLEAGKARGSANRYRLVMPDLPMVYDPQGGVTTSGTPPKGVQPQVAPGATLGATGVQPQVAHNPSNNPSEPKQGPAADAARELVTAWWDERAAANNPVGQPFIACTKVVESMLRNGVAASRLAWALRHAPVVSTAALELAIQQRLQRRAPHEHQPLDTDRTRPSEVLVL